MPDDDAPDTGADDTNDPKDDTPPATGGTVDWKAEADRFKALARKHEDRAKANDAKVRDLEPLAKRAKDLEDAGKSDMERLTSESQGHLSRADKAEGELMRLRVALRKGLTETQAKRLVGVTEDELESDADDLMASFKPAEPDKKDDDDEEPGRPDNSRRRPQERLRPGAVPDAGTEPEETDPRKLAALVPRNLV